MRKLERLQKHIMQKHIIQQPIIQKHIIRKILVTALTFLIFTLVFQAYSSKAAASTELSALAEARDIMALVYLCDELEVHEGASYDSTVTATLSSGQTVFIQDAVYNESEGKLWIYAVFTDGKKETAGYLDRQHLVCSDERFLDWEKNSGIAQISGAQVSDKLGTEGAGTPGTQLSPIYDSSVTSDVAQFPKSYQAGLMVLKKAHPQWIFVPMNTGLNWNTVITEELKGGKSLVYKSFPDYTKDGAYDDGNWYYATRGILEYYMDPRNALTDDRMFQFELLTYNKTYHTEEAVEKFLANTFMKSPDKAPGTVMTFAHIFWAVGAEEGREVSPFHLAARVYQEQGRGTSGLISGTYPGYEGYYNYFNVGASGTSTAAVIENGLKYAKQHNWNNAYYSILGGADVIAANYIKKGQDTLYLQKFNVNPNAANNLYTHQYMQNISAPTTEGVSMKKLYASADSLDNSFVFKIPVYENMPAAACPYPSPYREIALNIPDGYDTTVWVDGVPYTSELANGSRVVKIQNTTAASAVVYRYDGKIPTGMYVWTLTYQNNTYTVTEQSALKDLLTYHGFSIRISGDPGMRLKTGIDTELKTTLAGSGVDGYTLKEYGTIVTDAEDLTTNPLVKGGKGVVTGMSYGTTTKGKKTDLVYETVDGRQRFTSVLTGLPVSGYNTVYSFRGYVILTKNGKNCTIYGPVVSRSMVTLAQQVLKEGTYEKDSAEDSYLRSLLNDAGK